MMTLIPALRRATLACCLLSAGYGGFRLADELRRDATSGNDGTLLDSLEAVYTNLSVHLAMNEQMGPRLVLEDLRKKIGEVRTSGLNRESAALPWAAFTLLSLICGGWMIAAEIGVNPEPKRAGKRWLHWKESFVHSCSDGILQVDDALAIQYANPAAERMLGFASGELEGKQFSLVLPAAGSRKQAAARVRSRETARRKNGQMINVDTSIHRIAHENGSVVTAFTLRDSPQESSEATGRRADDFFQWAPAPLFIFDREGRVLHMNRSAEIFTGFAAAELGSAPYWTVFQEGNDAEQGKVEFESSLMWRDAVPAEQTWVLRDGRRVQIRLARAVMQDRNGLPSHIAAAVVPAQSAPSVDFTQLADHLTAVAGYAELLLMTVGDDDPMRPDLEQIQAAGAAAVRELTAAAHLLDGVKERVEV